MRTIYLVNAGNDLSMASIANDYSFPPLNILALGTWIKHRLPGFEVVCRDSGIAGFSAIQAEICQMKPWLVGVGVLATSYHTALKIAEVAKLSGAYTVLGNDQAANLSQNILRVRPYIDFVVGGEYGELPFELLIRKLAYDEGEFDSIDTLTFRDESGDVAGFNYLKGKDLLKITAYPFPETQRRKGALDIFPIVDRTLYPRHMWLQYLDNYMASFAHLHGDDPPSGITTMNRIRGCSRANENIKCKHCDMILDVSFSSPSIFWEDVRRAHQEVDAEVFYEVCDSLTSFPKHLARLVDAKPTDLDVDPKFFIYGQALDIVRNADLPELLSKLGVFKMNVGLESGCDITLKDMKGPKDSADINYEALKRLKAMGIHVYGSFVLGTDLETTATLRETTNFIKKIIDEDLISDVEAQPILPLPNNYFGKRLFAETEVHDTASDWPIDIDSVSREYVDRYSGVSYDQCVEAVNEIRQHASSKNKNFGSGVSKRSNYAV